MKDSSPIARALDQVGPRLKRLRSQQGVTLTALAEVTGISKSTLSRLDTGQRGASLELLSTQHPGGAQAWRILIPKSPSKPEPRTHEGTEWLYVMSGRMRLILGDRDLVLGVGDVAECDTRVSHWYGSTREHPAEVLSLLGRHGDRMHVRARSGQPSSG